MEIRVVLETELALRMAVNVLATLRPRTQSFEVVSMLLDTWGLSKHRRFVRDQRDFLEHGLVRS